MTAHQVVPRTIPQMRTPPLAGPGTLSVTTTIADRIVTVVVRDAGSPAAVEPLLTALDAVFASDLRGVILDCTRLTAWSDRSLEIGVLTAMRARGRRMGFAMCGLPDDRLALLRSRWPGVRSDPFTFPDATAARSALVSPRR